MNSEAMSVSKSLFLFAENGKFDGGIYSNLFENKAKGMLGCLDKLLITQTDKRVATHTSPSNKKDEL